MIFQPSKCFVLFCLASGALIACASEDGRSGEDAHLGIGMGQDEGSPSNTSTSSATTTVVPTSTQMAAPASTLDVAPPNGVGDVTSAPTRQPEPAPVVPSAMPEPASTPVGDPDVPATGSADQPQGNAGAGGANSVGGMGGTLAAGGRGGTPASGGTGGMAARGMGGMDAAPDLNIATGVATMVVRGAGTPTAGDNVMIERVEALGFTEIVVVSDAAVTAESVVGSDLVVISSSAESSPLDDKLKDIEIPVLCVEDAEFSKMAMARSGTHDDGISDVVIAGDGTPLTTELMGTVTISSVPGELGYATPEASAWIAATMPGNDMQAVVFGYEQGAQMVGMVAPARRAGFAIREVMAANLTEEGIALYDSILTWVLQ